MIRAIDDVLCRAGITLRHFAPIENFISFGRDQQVALDTRERRYP